MFTDIHYGARGSHIQQHLTDCRNFISYVMKLCDEQDIDAIVFLGDWFENRDAIQTHVLDAAYSDAERLNSIGIPVFFITGNHDLRLKTSRDIAATNIFSNLDNFHVITDEPYFVELAGNKCGFYPYLFNDEYVTRAPEINSLDYVFGHFEFKGFVVTGKTTKLEHGAEHTLFNKPKFIFSGHFHKRQIQENVVFIGNPFPTNYGDVDDAERGVAILDSDTDTLTFKNFVGPRFFYCDFSDLLDVEPDEFPPMSNITSYIDINLGYSDIQEVRSMYSEHPNIREIIIEDRFSASEMAKQDGDNFAGGVPNMPIEDLIRDTINTRVELMNSTISKERLLGMYDSIVEKHRSVS